MKTAFYGAIFRVLTEPGSSLVFVVRTKKALTSR